MKKVLHSLAFLFAAATMANAQSIPNNGFENIIVQRWEDPDFFQTANLDNMYHGYNVATVNKDTNAWHGKYALQLKTIKQGPDTIVGFAVDANFNGPTIEGGLPYSQKPTGVRFYYKYTRTAKDSGLVLVIFKNSNTIIGGAQIYLDTAANYKLDTQSFSLPFAPDTVVLGYVSSGGAINGANGVPGSVLTVDSISFTGVASQPANMNGDFEMWHADSATVPAMWDIQNRDSQFPFQNSTADAYTGHYALALSNVVFNSSGKDSTFSQEASTGSSGQFGLNGGYPFTNKKDTLEFYYKYTPANPMDSGRVQIQFKSGGSTFDYQNALLPAAASYTKFQFPFNEGTTPDSVIVTFQTDKQWKSALSYQGAILKVDNVRFTSQAVTPVAGFTNTGLVVCTGSSLTFTDTSANSPTSWNWTFAGGTPPNSTLSSQSVTYSSAGTYMVKLVVSNAAGSDSAMVTVNAVTQPNVTISSSKTTICTGDSAVLTASGANNYNWNTGSTNATIVVYPASTMQYMVTGTAVGGCQAKDSVLINVNTTPTVSVTPLSPTICASDSVQLTASGATTYVWSPAGSLNNNTIANPYAKPGSTVTYTVVGTSSGCASAGKTVTVIVNPLPTLTVTPKDTTICEGNFVMCGVSGASSYTWIPGTGLASTTGSSVIATPASSTCYTVTAIGGNGCINKDTICITVNPLPTFTLTASPDTICQGNTSNLSAAGATSYTWAGSSLSCTNCTNPTSAATTTTTYTVTATTAGCSAVDSIQLVVQVCTGVNTVTNASEVNIYPNPSNGVFNYELGVMNNDLKTIEVYNVLGERIQTFITHNSSFIIDLKASPAGIYFYRLLNASGKEVKSGKLIKE